MPAGDRWFFERFARPYALLMPRADAEPLERALAAADRPVERVVDVAGGTGRGVAALEVPDRLVVDAAAGMLRRVPPGMAAIGGDAARLPLRSDAVDAVLVVDALHHLPDAEAALSEARRVLRPGGVVVVPEFDPETVRGRLVEVVEHAVGFESTFRPVGAIADLVGAAGFDAVVTDRGFSCTVVGVVPGAH